ncbi:hypothetical protein JWG44_19215 [Leptospira sp. 201903071]|uniref:hypothetical protein n=1 Tax=Leptospira ainazelensis TaxID=2810034 RepID=UPI001963CCC2|nr:hypothetical protein [Leptospira ainazelensis]MBM9502386.1 hypothetical protein [Leptospira ainazelensis]
MLKFAYYYKEKLQSLFSQRIYDEELKYYYFPNLFYEISLDPTSEKRIQLVSVDDSNEVLGFFSLRIDWKMHFVEHLMSMNLKGRSSTFSQDFYQLLYDIFYKYNFVKLKFSVAVGNPAEKFYDRMMTKYGGRIVGVFKQDLKLIDGTVCDYKYYEILKSELEQTLISLNTNPKDFFLRKANK